MNNLELDYFLELQLNMTDIFRYVACHERNFGCFSIRIESSLIDISAFFDSVCQDFIRLRYAEWSVRKKIGGAGAPDAEGFKASNKTTKLEEKVSGKAEFNMGDYQTLLEAEFLLSHCEVQLRPYQQNYPSLKCPDGYKLRPFLQWEYGHKLSWWEAFTKLKHDRINNFQQATLGNAINALAAVFIVLSFKYQEDFRGGLLVGETYSLFFPLYWTKAGVSCLLFPHGKITKHTNKFSRRKDGHLERIEHYQGPLDGPGPIQRYVRNRRDRNFSWPQNTASQVRDIMPTAYGHAPFF